MGQRRDELDQDDPAAGVKSKPKPCPECGAPMIAGEFRVEGTALSWLFVGISHMHCWFRPRGAGSREVVVHCDGARPGYRCPECATALITDPDHEPYGWENMRRKASGPVTPASGDPP